MGVVTARWEGRVCGWGPRWALGRRSASRWDSGQGRAEGLVGQDSLACKAEARAWDRREAHGRPCPAGQNQHGHAVPLHAGQSFLHPGWRRLRPKRARGAVQGSSPRDACEAGGCLSQVTWQLATKLEFDLGGAAQTSSPRCWQHTRCAEMADRWEEVRVCLTINGPVAGPPGHPGVDLCVRGEVSKGQVRYEGMKLQKENCARKFCLVMDSEAFCHWRRASWLSRET